MSKVGNLLKITFLCLLMSYQTVYSQVTTSVLSGNVSDGGGALPGATITVTHLPTGTRTGAVADGRGDYRVLNLRPGGPYTISFSFVGYKTQEHHDIMLVLGDVYALNAHLDEDSQSLGEVVIVGVTGPSNMHSERAGAITSITSREMASMPTITRSINDMIRLTPQANGQSIGGGNSRQNFITVDGAAFNNAFGIGGNLPGNGTPISIDALEQISVSLTPYDVRQSGFIGATVNAVTKSGTNQFRGSAYHYRTDERLRGNKVGDVFFVHDPAQTNIYGVTLGGPVVKDKLFFFVNYENENNVAPGPARVASVDGVANNANNIARPTAAEMDMVSRYLKETYGYETGPYQGYSFDSPLMKFLTRVDWNINDNHKINVRYSYMTRKDPALPSTSNSPTNPPNLNRQNMSAMWFQNSGYFQERNFSSLSAEVNSRFMNGLLNNTLRFSWSFQNEPRSTGGNIDFPFVDIRKDGDAFTSFGTELFSFGNLREVNTYNITNETTYHRGINNFTFGLNYEMNHIKNGFMQAGTGWYVFDTWDDFVNGELPTHYTITFSNTPGYAQAFPSFKFDQLSFYLQNEMKLSNRLNLTLGMRFDLPIYPEHPEGLIKHPMVSELDFNGTFYDTSVMPKTRLLISPRLGFNFDVLGDRQVVLRGGTGIFAGRLPFVWICSQSGNAGMIQSTMIYTGDDVPGPFNPDPRAYLPDVQPQVGTTIPTGGFTVMDPDFKFPSAWKSSLAVDFKLPMGINASIEGVVNKDINAVLAYRDGMVDPVAMNIPGYSDNRLMYPSGAARFTHRLDANGQPTETGANGATPYVVKNVTKGNGYYSSLTFKVEKPVWEGLSAMIAYTRSWAKSLHDGGGDQMSSVWSGLQTVHGGNTPELGHSSFVDPNSIVGALTFRHKGFTTSVFYAGSNNGRTSYRYTTNIVNDGGGNNLIYVPKDRNDIIFVDRVSGGNVTHTAQEQSDAFWAYIEQDPYLKTRKGQYAEKNALVFPWRHRFDVKFTQDFNFNVGNSAHTIQLGMDIVNASNLLNSEWGTGWAANQTSLLAMTNANQVTPTGAVIPTFNLNPMSGSNDLPTETFRKSTGAAATYRIQFSIRYFFN
ncbi:MAG: carboxypeptidase regulatory-like domain-containing protein [Bacteroidales bacterium]|nr:carboxypeptidase regulatory-like domain-containing protein [Bacteroidales bacterium]